jgi:hypothetical protein
MTLRTYIFILTISLCSTNVFVSCAQSQSKVSEQIIDSKNMKSSQIDTSNTAVILFDQNSNYLFGDSCKSATLTQIDISNIDSLLIACVTEYNNSLDKDHKRWGIDLKKYNYKKQLIVVTNKKGEKEVWVNCFCSTWGNDRWKTEVMGVKDGGNCYFNFKINLKAGKFYEMSVNGVA